MDELEKIKQSIIDEIKSLPLDSDIIMEHQRDIDIVLDPNFWNTRGRDPAEFLTRFVSLMKYKPNISLKSASFEHKCEKLLLAKYSLDFIPNWWNQEGPHQLIDEICEALTRVPQDIDEVIEKRPLIDAILTQPDFWSDISTDKIRQIRDELSPVMIYQQSEPIKTILIRMDDVIQQRDTIRYGPNQIPIDSSAYIARVEQKIRDLADSDPTILKIKNNEKLTEKDIELLADTLMSSELGITVDTLAQAYNTPKKDIVEFIKHVLGLTKLSNKDEMIQEAFSGFLLTKNFSADQVFFIQILESVFLSKKHIEYGDFFDPPFTNLGRSVTSYFEKEQLLEVVDFCKILEAEVNQ